MLDGEFASMPNSVLVFPVLPGVELPRLAACNLLQSAEGPSAVQAIDAAKRSAVQILLTTSQLGCDAQLLQLLPNLRLVISLGAGTDRIDRSALVERGVDLRPIGEALTEDVADLAFCLAVMAARGLRAADAFARSGEWGLSRFPAGRSLSGATMGIAGLSGRIGQAVARRAIAAQMTVLGLARPSAESLGYALRPDIVALALEADVLVLCLPGGSETHHIVDVAVLDALGSHGILVNVGRGELVDTVALIDALSHGRIAAAGLDVLEGEPQIPADLAALGNCVLTPHIGGATWEARARAAAIAETEVLQALRRYSRDRLEANG